MADLTGTEHLDDEELSALVDARRAGEASSATAAEHAGSCAECTARLRAMERAVAATRRRPSPSTDVERERVIAAALGSWAAEDGEPGARVAVPRSIGSSRRPGGQVGRRTAAALGGVAAIGAVAALGLTLTNLHGNSASPSAQFATHGASSSDSPQLPANGITKGHGISLTLTPASPLEFRQLLSTAPGACKSPSSEADSSAAGQAATFDDYSAEPSTGGGACVTVGGPIISLQAPLPIATHQTDGTLVISVPSGEARALSAFEADQPQATIAVVAGSVVVAYLPLGSGGLHAQADLSTQSSVVLTKMTPSAADALAAALRG